MICLFFCIRTVHLDTIKAFYSPTNAQVFVLKKIKFTLKLLQHAFGAVTPLWCDCTETCRSNFNVNFDSVFKTITCAIVGE